MLFGIVTITTLAMVTTVVSAYVWSSRQSNANALRGVSYQAQLAAKTMTTSINDTMRAMAGWSSTPSFAQAFRTPQDCSLNATAIGSFSSVHIDIIRPDGTVACTSLSKTGSPKGAHIGQPEWLGRALAADQPIFSPVLVDPLTHQQSIVLAAPVVSKGRPVGVIALVVRSDQVAQDLAATYGGVDHLTFTIVDLTPGLVSSASGSPADVGRSVAASPFAGRQSGRWKAFDGPEQVFGSADITPVNWRIYTGISEAHVTASARDTARREALVGLVALLAVALMAYTLNRRIARPLRRVTKAIAHARDDPLPSPVAVDGPREIAILSREFNMMLDARLDYEAQISRQALHDALTGLPNRGLLNDRLASAVNRIHADHTGLVAVLFLDLDRFKYVNDTFGHPAGDALLREVATRLATGLRPGDTLARFGGDEFVVVCENVSDAAQAVDIAKRMATALNGQFTVDGTPVALSASIGIALADESARDPDDLIREADIAMYAAKESGRGWELCDHELRIKTARRTEIEQDLRVATTRNEFVVEYQPIYQTATRNIIGAEALVRWEHPTKGRIPPNDFIPIAEETGDINAIGQQVLTQACTDIAKLQSDGKQLSIAVNVAVGQLTDTFAATVADILQTSGLPAGQLHLEITEGSLVRAFGPAADTLARLHALGISLAIDDFGTGYSSLSYLQRFPFDVLKIDRSFIEALGRNASARAIVDAMLSMARALKLHVVAEGVETETQLAMLTDLGCPFIQGFLFARPMPLAQLEQLVATDAGTDQSSRESSLVTDA